MPRVNKMTTPVAMDVEQIEARYAEIGPYTVGFESYRQDVDPAAFFRGLPDDRCQCPHWGTVTSGQVTFRWSDHSETYVAGDAYYAPPGHLPLVTAGTSVVEFSPTDDLNRTMAVLQENMAALTGAES